MERKNRSGYGFTVQDRENVAKRAGSNCEFNDCVRPNNGIAHHLEGCFIARLDSKPKSAISDPSMNALKLCDPHALMLDIEQEYQVNCLIYERNSRRNKSSNKSGFNKTRR